MISNRSAFTRLPLAFLFCLAGCSYYYTLHIDGQLLAGPDQTPVPNATVTLFAGAMNYAEATTDSNGRWAMTYEISDGEFGVARNGRREHDSQMNSRHPCQFRITIGEREMTVPFPRIFAPESGQDIFASVLTIMERQPDLQTEDATTDSLKHGNQ